MSYILEALKKADAERERTGVPDLHAQPDAIATDTRAAGLPGNWRWAAAIVALLMAAMAWQWFDSEPAARDPVAPAALPLPLPGPAPTAAATPAPAPVAGTAPAAAPTATPTPTPTPTPAPAPAAIVTAAPGHAPAPVARDAPAEAAAPRSTTRPRPVAVATTARRTVVPPIDPAPSASAAAEAKLHSLAELPPDVRATLPALTVGGSVYSPSAASRIVILNGQVFREGDRPVEGLSVEQIRLKSTVLAFRGYRFELKH